MGAMYNYGEGVKQDKFKAFELYTKACDRGYAQAAQPLGEPVRNPTDPEPHHVRANAIGSAT
ncbi:MAG: SEL1-like repeat protein [Betaproteobacteria bacterium]|nr:SEL1-like repeat protein [Betaproteobacteria bacterium]